LIGHGFSPKGIGIEKVHHSIKNRLFCQAVLRTIAAITILHSLSESGVGQTSAENQSGLQVEGDERGIWATGGKIPFL